MNIISRIQDLRIKGENILLDCTFGEYLNIAPEIIGNNEFQRKRVKTSKTVYSLLKEDLERGCIIPPIVLAISGVKDDKISDENIDTLIQNNKSKILILDGLQRTYTLIDADAEMRNGNPVEYEQFKNHKMRIELYNGINKFGILYRMLTLNTGQTPMSLRHQLEMLYSDLLNTDTDGMKLVKDTEGKADPDNHEFVFQNAIDGFNAYLSRNELPIDRVELLDNIRVMEKMSEEAGDDIFKSFLEAFLSMFDAFQSITGRHEVTEEEKEEHKITGVPFGKKTSKIFSSSQAMTGFGAAVGKLKDSKRINGFQDTIDSFATLKDKYDGNHEYEWILSLLERLDKIRNTSKKIGNAQRMLFQYFFRELLNPETDSHLDLDAAVLSAYDKYLSQVV